MNLSGRRKIGSFPHRICKEYYELWTYIRLPGVNRHAQVQFKAYLDIYPTDVGTCKACHYSQARSLHFVSICIPICGEFATHPTNQLLYADRVVESCKPFSAQSSLIHMHYWVTIAKNKSNAMPSWLQTKLLNHFTLLWHILDWSSIIFPTLG